jgi:hypothetical protein
LAPLPEASEAPDPEPHPAANTAPTDGARTSIANTRARESRAPTNLVLTGLVSGVSAAKVKASGLLGLATRSGPKQRRVGDRHRAVTP